jgi:hypothetical protein
LNSINRIDFIFLSNSFVLLQILEVLNYLNLIQINPKEKIIKGTVPFGPPLTGQPDWPSQHELAAHG